MTRDAQNRESVSTLVHMVETGASRLYDKLDNNMKNEICDILEDVRSRHVAVKHVHSRLVSALSSLDAIDKGMAWSAA